MNRGKNIGIQVTESPPDQSWISVSSASKFSIIDFGKNRKNVDKLLAEVGNVLAETGYTEVSRQQEQQTPVASPGQAAAAV